MRSFFDEIIERRGTNSYKWDVPEAAGALPLWVADMDFRTAPPIVEALQARVAHGIFGYTQVPESYYEAVMRWFRRRHGWTIRRESIQYTSGVVPALSAVIKALTHPGDRVVVQTPVYNCFFSSIRNNGCEVGEAPLVYADGRYRMDFQALEAQCALPQTKLLLLCNPHNPVGRVWTRVELERVADIAGRHGVTVVSDEIHCELVFPPHVYIPYATVGSEARAASIVLCSPSKAFNLAGLQIANIVTDNAEWRRRIDRAINDNEVCDVNPFGVVALQAAYDKGEPWLHELIKYLQGNYTYLRAWFESYLPAFNVLPLEGTYLVWVDCRHLKRTSDELCRLLLRDARVLLNSGTMYGAAGEGFLRINIACPRARLIDALERIQKVLAKL